MSPNEAHEARRERETESPIISEGLRARTTSVIPSTFSTRTRASLPMASG